MQTFTRWIAREPVRFYLYGLAGAIVLLLVGYGVLDGERAGLVLGVVVAALAVPTAKQLRSRVSPAPGRRRATPPAQRVE